MIRTAGVEIRYAERRLPVFTLLNCGSTNTDLEKAVESGECNLCGEKFFHGDSFVEDPEGDGFVHILCLEDDNQRGSMIERVVD